MRALVLERNKMVSRRLGRFFTSAGFEVVAVHDPKEVGDQMEGIGLLAADAFDGDLVMEQVQARPGLRGVLWTAEPLKRSIRYLIDNPAVSNIMGRKDFESTPYPWEIMMTARRILRPTEAPPSFASYLDWGFKGYQDRIADTAGRDEAVQKAQRFIAHLGVPKRIGELYGELTHEMLMNAMYDAPADPNGNAKYAQDRKANLSLPDPEQPTLRLATDGTRLVIQVVDPFGRLQRKHVFAGLARGLAGGEMDTSHGGAGLGMVVCHNATVAMFFDVETGKKTSVTGVFDLDMNLREFRTRAKSLHFFQR